MDELEKTEEVASEEKTTEAVVENKEAEVIEKPVTKETITEFYNPKKAEEIKKVVEPEAEVAYEFKKIDGFDYDEEVLTKVKDFSKSNKLTVDNAQKVVELAAEFVNRDKKKTEELVLNRVKAWDETTRRDKEIGGVNLPENLKIAKAFLKKYGNDEVMNVLRQTGLASHPEIIRMLFRAGKSISEDNFVSDPGITRNSNPQQKNEIGETVFRFPSLEKK
jgi:hypothetical protein